MKINSYIKQTAVFIVSIIIYNGAYSQKIDSVQFSAIEKKEFLSKSRVQKAIGWTMLSTGLPVVITFGYFVIAFTDYEWDESWGRTVFIGSVAYTLASIPLIKAGKQNKKRALSINLIENKIIIPEQNAMSYKMQPAISLKIPLN